jgi:hypothetical protein
MVKVCVDFSCLWINESALVLNCTKIIYLLLQSYEYIIPDD